MLEQELHKEQFMARFRMALTKQSQKQEEVPPVGGQGDGEEGDILKQGETVEERIKKTLYGDDKYARRQAKKLNELNELKGTSTTK